MVEVRVLPEIGRNFAVLDPFDENGNEASVFETDDGMVKRPVVSDVTCSTVPLERTARPAGHRRRVLTVDAVTLGLLDTKSGTVGAGTAHVIQVRLLSRAELFRLPV
ncbi:hypothetical protein [Halomarina oriensis]|uniref:Uncharacterized protein n=1 Tax=Halomarina oriensis TaxID=671145 RepID=A0A6B0GQB0_9EURY|nr:hypothetical protein [Halomarina oriensis]MWG33848.1 hypothetical protein [Halomarina oriensis]